jgi:hypothetical protein
MALAKLTCRDPLDSNSLTRRAQMRLATIADSQRKTIFANLLSYLKVPATPSPPGHLSREKAGRAGELEFVP